MTSETPVAAARAPLARAGGGRLPLPAVPKERWLRPTSRGKRSLGTAVGVFGSLAGVVGAGAFLGLPSGVVWVPVGAWFAWVAWRVIRVRRFNAENSALLTLINQGDPAAVPALEDLARRYRRTFTAHHVAVFNLGVACLLTGDPARALSLFHAFWRARVAPALLEVVGFHIAACHALLGDLTAADAWLDDASRRVKHPHRRADVLPRAILLLRRGQHAECARVLADDWARAESIYVGLMLHALQGLRAFAMVRAGTPADADEIRALLGSTKLSGRGLGFLVVDWPELRAFLVENGVRVE